MFLGKQSQTWARHLGVDSAGDPPEEGLDLALDLGLEAGQVPVELEQTVQVRPQLVDHRAHLVLDAPLLLGSCSNELYDFNLIVYIHQ